MEAAGIQAIPVVDEQGVIVTTLSTWDANCLNANNLKLVLLPVLGTLSSLRKRLIGI